MKIAYVLGEYPSLSETFIAREMEALRRRGFVIDIWALRAGEGARFIPEAAASHCWEKILKRFSASVGAEYFRRQGQSWAKNHRQELRGVEHIHAGWASYPAWIAEGASEVLRVPWSFSGHARDLWVDGENLPAKLNAAKFASACTRAGAEYLQSLAPEAAGRVLYAPHGIEPGRFEFRDERELHEPIRLIAIGRLVEKKGFPILLHAVAILQEKEYSINLTIIGEGPQRRELEKMVREIRNPQLKLAGAYSHLQIVGAMNEADLFVMPSTLARDGDRDGLPNVLLEAAACGLPIVSTRAGSIVDFLDESCAWLCEPGNSASLSDAIESAIRNYGESVQRAKNARARVEADFDIEKNIDVLARAFEFKVGQR